MGPCTSRPLMCKCEKSPLYGCVENHLMRGRQNLLATFEFFFPILAVSNIICHHLIFSCYHAQLQRMSPHIYIEEAAEGIIYFAPFI